MIDREVRVTQTVLVAVDESKFTPEFMAEFRRHFYDFHTLDDHIEHIAQLVARGLVDDFTKFIEGYGPPAEMGIRFHIPRGSTETEVLGESPYTISKSES